MKILFLDIDGVLNSTKTAMAHGGFPLNFAQKQAFDQAAIGLLHRLCDSNDDVKIVLSSTWRLHYTAEQAAAALELPIIDRTPLLHGPRGYEISAWLGAHPEITEYVILDDNNDMLDMQRPRFVRTDGDEGMSLANFREVCRILDVAPYAGKARDRAWRNLKDPEPVSIDPQPQSKED